MKPRTALFTALLVTVFNAAPVVAAQGGLDLAWGGCASTAISYVDVSPACDDNNEIFDLYASMVAPDGVLSLEGIEAWIDIQYGFLPVQDWWQLEAGGCRDGSLALSFTAPALKACSQLITQGVSSSTLDYFNYPGKMNTGLAQIFATATLAAPVNLTPWLKYYVLHLTLDTQHAAPIATEPGYRVCGGCQVGACITFPRLTLRQPSGDIVLSAGGHDNLVTWQSGRAVTCFYVPVRRPTWGEVKSLYR